MFLLYIAKWKPGWNPDREIGEFLTNHTNFAHIARTLGAIEYRVRQEDESEGSDNSRNSHSLRSQCSRMAGHTRWTIWVFSLNARWPLVRTIRRLKELTSGTPFALSSQPVPRVITELLGGHAETAVLLGRCTAELHAALSSHPEMPEFAPEPFTEFYRHSLYHGFLAQMNKSLDALRHHVEQLSGAAHEEARAVLEQQETLGERFNALRDMRISGMRMRHHGDYHLGECALRRQQFHHQEF